MAPKYFKVSALCLFTISASSAFAGDLHTAARKGDVDRVAELLAAGAAIDELDNIVGAPLHWAAGRGHLDVASFLLENGADPNQPGRAPDLLTPTHLAASAGRIEMVKLLLEAGARLSSGQGRIGTPLHFASTKNQVDVVRLLLSEGADPFAMGKDGCCEVLAFHFAAKEGAVETLQIFLERGFPVDASNEDTGITALHLAMNNTQLDAAKLLVDAGADVNAKSTIWGTPLDIAKESPEFEKRLAEMGIK